MRQLVLVSGEQARQRCAALLDAVDAAYRELGELSTDTVGNGFRVEVAERLEAQLRGDRGVMYRVFGQIADPPDEPGTVADVPHRLAERLPIPMREVRRRFRTAARILPRRQLSDLKLGDNRKQTELRAFHCSHRRGKTDFLI